MPALPVSAHKVGTVVEKPLNSEAKKVDFVRQRQYLYSLIRTDFSLTKILFGILYYVSLYSQYAQPGRFSKAFYG